MNYKRAQAKRRYEIQQQLEMIGLDENQSPGFYDHPMFLAAEQTNSDILELYADYINTRGFTSEYLDEARTIIIRTATLFFDELVLDGRLGACIDASLALSRMLERQGIWNYAVKGGMAYNFPTELERTERRLSPLVMPGNPALTGHVWLVAPPFEVVDVTWSQQKDISDFIPDSSRQCIFGEQGKRAEVRPEHLMDDDLMAYVFRRTGRPPRLQDAFRFGDVRLPEKLLKYPATRYEKNGIHLTYIPAGITVSVEQLEDWRSLCLSGQYPVDLYNRLLAGLKVN